jgi:hypothetical protein
MLRDHEHPRHPKKGDSTPHFRVYDLPSALARFPGDSKMFDAAMRPLHPFFSNKKTRLMTKGLYVPELATPRVSRLIRKYNSQLPADVYQWRLAALVIANGQPEDTKGGGTTGVQTGELPLKWPNGAVSAVFS